MDNSLLIPVGGVAFVLLLINIRFVFSLVSAQRQRAEDLKLERDTEVKNLKDEISQLKAKHAEDMTAADKRHRKCERVSNILIYTLQKNNIQVPETIWEKEVD